MSNTLERVKKIVTSQIDVDEASVKEEARFIEDLNLDSLDTVELVMAFEEEFDCEIPDNEASKILTIKDAVTYIDEHRKKD